MNVSYNQLAARQGGSAMSLPAHQDSQAMLNRIVALRPWLRGMQAQAEAQRRVPQETVERLQAAGVYQVTSPWAAARGVWPAPPGRWRAAGW